MSPGPMRFVEIRSGVQQSVMVLHGVRPKVNDDQFESLPERQAYVLNGDRSIESLSKAKLVRLQRQPLDGRRHQIQFS